jgi:general secretion pathway protein K
VKGFRRDRGLNAEEGFALVAVILLCLLMSIVAYVFTSAVRSHLRNAAAQVGAAEAEAAADAGVNLAVLDLLRAGQDDSLRRFAIDGRTAVCSLSQGQQLAIRIRDEAGRIDLNAAREELIRSFLAGLGIASSDIEPLLAALADFKDRDQERRLNGAEAEDYSAAGLPGRPKNAPLDVFEELGRVRGVDGALLSRIRPFVTVFSGIDGVDPGVAPPELGQILSRGLAETDLSSIALGSAETVPPQFSAASLKNTFSIDVEAVTSGGARFVREAVVTLNAGPQVRRSIAGQNGVTAPGGPVVRFWRWRRGDTVFAAGLTPTQARPPC